MVHFVGHYRDGAAQKRRVICVAFVAAICFASPSIAKPSSPDCDSSFVHQVSCTPLTERLLLSLRGATKEDVRSKMHSPGSDVEGGGEGENAYTDGLNYWVDVGPYHGAMLVYFRENRVVIISATVFHNDQKFDLIWNVNGGGARTFLGTQQEQRSGAPRLSASHDVRNIGGRGHFVKGQRVGGSFFLDVHSVAGPGAATTSERGYCRHSHQSVLFRTRFCRRLRPWQDM